MPAVLSETSQSRIIANRYAPVIRASAVEYNNRREGKIKRMTFGDLLAVESSLVKEDFSLRISRELAERWIGERPFFDPFNGLIENGVYSPDLDRVWNAGTKELSWLVNRVVEEAIESRDAIINFYTPEEVVKNANNGIYSHRSWSIKEVLDIEVFAAEAENTVGVMLITHGLDSSYDAQPHDSDILTFLNSILSTSAEEGILMLAEKVGADFSRLATDVEGLKYWSDTRLQLLRRLNLRHMDKQGIDIVKELPGVLHQNSLNYPAELFSQSMLDWVVGRGLVVHEAKNLLQKVVKKLRVMTMPGSVNGQTFLEFFRQEIPSGAPAYIVVDWLNFYLPEKLKEGILPILNGVVVSSNGIVTVNNVV
ncbi:hypothetical protein HOD19_03120 [bacterium]|jgi:hypothetical protein|nr:hypothetical protein [bacterium]